MKAFILHILIIVLCNICFGQNNALVLNNNPYLVFNGGTIGNPVYLVVNQDHANGIVTQGTGGNIISENEYNYVKWNIGTTTGTYTVPFTTGVGGTEQKIPLSVNTTTAGVGTGNVLFSTYESDDDNLPWPSGVTHFMSSSGNLDNKDWVVDRFWIIDAENYTTKPAVQLSFGFNDDATEVGAPNTLNVTNLGAQRFNTSNNHWEGSHSGSNGIWGNVVGSAGNRSVINVNIAASEFYRSWTLTDYDHPLPLILNSFYGNCNNSTVSLDWDISNDENTVYEIKKSIDGINFSTIGTVNSNQNETSFTYIDRNPYMDQSYYKLVVPNSTQIAESEIITVRPCENQIENFIFSPLNNSDIYIELTSKRVNETSKLLLIDLGGKIILQKELNAPNKGNNQFMVDGSGIAKGIYNAVLIDQYGSKTVRKLIL